MYRHGLHAKNDCDGSEHTVDAVQLEFGPLLRGLSVDTKDKKDAGKIRENVGAAIAKSLQGSPYIA